MQINLPSLRRVARSPLLVAFVIAATTGALAATLSDHQSPAERALQWAQAHRDVVPATLDELAAYPAPYRRALFHLMPLEAKSAMWREQLRRIVDTEDLNPEQREFLERVITLVTPESFAEGAERPKLCEDLARLFQDDRLRPLFSSMNIGLAAQPSFALRPAFLTLTEKARSSVTALAKQAGRDCNCNNDGWCECLFYDCGDRACDTLNPILQSCGCIWPEPCLKFCGPPWS